MKFEHIFGVFETTVLKNFLSISLLICYRIYIRVKISFDYACICYNLKQQDDGE